MADYSIFNFYSGYDKYKSTDYLALFKVGDIKELSSAYYWIDENGNPVIDGNGDPIVFDTGYLSADFALSTQYDVIDLIGTKEQRLRVISDAINVPDNECNLILNRWAWSFFINKRGTLKQYTPTGNETFVSAKTYPVEDMSLLLQLDRLAKWAYNVNKDLLTYDAALSSNYVKEHPTVLSSQAIFQYYNWLPLQVLSSTYEFPHIEFIYTFDYGILNAPDVNNLRVAIKIYCLITHNNEKIMRETYFYI